MDSSFTNLSQFGCKVTQFYVNFQIIPTKNAKNLIPFLTENNYRKRAKPFVSQRQRPLWGFPVKNYGTN